MFNREAEVEPGRSTIRARRPARRARAPPATVRQPTQRSVSWRVHSAARRRRRTARRPRPRHRSERGGRPDAVVVDGGQHGGAVLEGVHDQRLGAPVGAGASTAGASAISAICAWAAPSSRARRGQGVQRLLALRRAGDAPRRSDAELIPAPRAPESDSIPVAVWKSLVRARCTANSRGSPPTGARAGPGRPHRLQPQRARRNRVDAAR